MLYPSQSVVDQVDQFVGSTVNGLVKCGGLIGDGKGLMSFEAGFDHAAHTVVASLVFAVLIAQVHINRGDAIADSA